MKHSRAAAWMSILFVLLVLGRLDAYSTINNLNNLSESSLEKSASYSEGGADVGDQDVVGEDTEEDGDETFFGENEDSTDELFEEQMKKTIEDIDSNPNEDVFRITEFTSAVINITYVNKHRRVLHTEKKDIGMYSSSGVSHVAGIATRLRSKEKNESVNDYACSLPLQFIPSKAPMIAVIKRGLCTFDTKVKNAMSVGMVGVLIYDNVAEDHLKTIQVSSDSVPTVFTYKWFGEKIVNQLSYNNKIFLTIEEGSHCQIRGKTHDLYCTRSSDFTPNQKVFNYEDPFSELGNGNRKKSSSHASSSVLFVSVSFLVLIMISMVWLLLYYVQRFRFIHSKDELERHLGRQAKQALSCVTLVVMGEEEGECTVCLEPLRAGDEARFLPCAHTFHRPCIDNWLLSKRKCPLCNLNIVEHFSLIESSGCEESLYSQEDQTTDTAL